jgi:hypothetical protein
MAWNIRPEGRYGLISSGLPGLTPSEKWKNHFVFVHFSRSAVPSSFPKGTWTRRIFHPVKYAGQCRNAGEIDWSGGKFDRPFAKIYWRLSKIW